MGSNDDRIIHAPYFTQILLSSYRRSYLLELHVYLCSLIADSFTGASHGCNLRIKPKHELPRAYFHDAR